MLWASYYRHRISSLIGGEGGGGTPAAFSMEDLEPAPSDLNDQVP